MQPKQKFYYLKIKKESKDNCFLKILIIEIDAVNSEIELLSVRRTELYKYKLSLDKKNTIQNRFYHV
jgi:hypothetical protein